MAFFFEKEQGEAVTVNDNRYIGPCSTNVCSQKLKGRTLATFGFNRTALRATQPKLHSDVLRPVFEDRIISRRADVVWPPRSCDLTPLDFYLWGAAKNKCYADKARNN